MHPYESKLEQLNENLPELHSHFVSEHSRAILDSSKLQDYQSCPRKFFYRHILGWDNEEPSFHLHFGKCWHKGLEKLYSEGFSADNMAAAAHAFLAAYDEQSIPVPSKSYKTADAAIKAIFEYSQKYVWDVQNFEVVAVESPYAIPISRERSIIVNRDVLLRERTSQDLVILEHKTASSLGRTFDQQWRLSLQIAMYAYSAYLEGVTPKIPKVIVNATCFKAAGAEFHRVPVMRNFSGINNALYTANSLWDDIEADITRLYNIDLEADFLQAFRQAPSSCANFTGCQFYDYCTCCGNPLNLESPPIGMTLRFWNPEDAYL